MKYHYQGKIWEAPEEGVSQAGHAFRIQQGSALHYVWPEQVIREGIPEKDPYGLVTKGPTLHPEQFLTGRVQAQPEVKPAREVAAKVQGISGGEIELSTICAELGIEPSEARKILRKKMDKPAGRWAFAPSAVDQVKAWLKGG